MKEKEGWKVGKEGSEGMSNCKEEKERGEETAGRMEGRGKLVVGRKREKEGSKR